jgi:hypothetical protein
VGLEQSPPSLVSTIQELLDRKKQLFSRNLDYGRRDSSRWPHGTLYPQKLALTSPTSGGHSVSIVRSRTQATEFLRRTNLTKLVEGSVAYKTAINLLSYNSCSKQLPCNTCYRAKAKMVTETHGNVRIKWATLLFNFNENWDQNTDCIQSPQCQLPSKSTQRLSNLLCPPRST